MEFDKSNASVLPGGLPGKTEILVLLCYILKTVNQPVPSSRLRELLHYEGISNYFEVSAAFADLENSGHIKRVDDSEDSFVITPLGIDASDTLESSLSRTVKSRACTATIKMLSRLRHEKETKIEISPGFLQGPNGYPNYSPQKR